jgi:hypothetical protein
MMSKLCENIPNSLVKELRETKIMCTKKSFFNSVKAQKKVI